MPKSLHYPVTNLYTSVVDFIYFCSLVESPLENWIQAFGKGVGSKYYNMMHS